jgi:hypothetical protein
MWGILGSTRFRIFSVSLGWEKVSHRLAGQRKGYNVSRMTYELREDDICRATGYAD